MALLRGFRILLQLILFLSIFVHYNQSNYFCRRNTMSCLFLSRTFHEQEGIEEVLATAISHHYLLF